MKEEKITKQQRNDAIKIAIKDELENIDMGLKRRIDRIKIFMEDLE